MASPRESRGSDTGRLIAAWCALAAFDARAHSFGMEVWGIPMLIGLGGPVACLCLHLIHGSAKPAARIFVAIALVLLDVAIWIGLVFLSFAAFALMHIEMSDVRSIPLFIAIGFWPWILPAAMWFRARKRRGA